MKRVLFILLLLLSYVNVHGQSNFVYEEELRIDKIPESDHFFGKVGGLSLDKNGNIFLTENAIGHIVIISKDGSLKHLISRKGNGPGEFQRVNSMLLDDNQLYAFDDQLSKIIVFDYENGELLKEKKLESQFQFPGGFYKYGSNFLFIGYLISNEDYSLFHIFDEEFEYQSSEGELVTAGQMPGFMARAKHQILQADIDINKTGMYLLMAAPYMLAKYDDQLNQKWVIKDEVIPEPWVEYIKISADRYSVRQYPMTNSVHSISDTQLLIQWFNSEEKKSWLDIRNKEDGSLSKRMEFTFDEVIHDLEMIAQNEGYLVTLDRSDYSIRRYRWYLE